MSAIVVPATDSWGALTPHDALVVLSVLGAPWWIAGGWALDLFLGKVTRAHKDLDVGVFRKDAAIVVAALTDWDCFEAKDGVLTPLVQSNTPRAEVNSLWCKRVNAARWELELMLDDSHGEFWAFRRNALITRPLSLAIRRNADGIPYLAPEIQLLYKARATRAEDQADFDHVVPHLDRAEKTWLQESLSCMDPEHAWISLLEETM
jgi:hypothetical protein